MATLRLQPFNTSLTADGTPAGLLTVASTTGITRNSHLSIGTVSDGWRVEVIRVIDATHVLARMTGFLAAGPSQQNHGNAMDLSVIPNGAAVILEEQWVHDVQQDDAPANLAIPTK